MERPRWPYTVGSLGALVFALGAFALLFMFGAEMGSEGKLKVAAGAFVLGSATLGVGWIGIFQQRQAGIGVIAGSFAMPLATLVIRASDPADIFSAVGMILLVAAAFFALAHAFVKNMPFTRLIAAVSALAWIVAIVTTVAKVQLGRDLDKLLLIGGLGGLGMLGIALAVNLPELRREPVDDEGIPRL